MWQIVNTCFPDHSFNKEVARDYIILTLKLVVHSQVNIINALYLIAICWTVAIIKINLQQSRTIVELQPGICFLSFLFSVHCIYLPLSLLAQLSPTCNPWAEDLSPIIRRCVSQGERSPMSTCLQCNLSGAGLTLQLGSFRMWAVSCRKPGNSPVRSNWTFRRTLKFKTLQKSENIS